MKLNYNLKTTEDRLKYINDELNKLGVSNSDYICSELEPSDVEAMGNYLLHTYEKEQGLKQIRDKEQNKTDHERVMIDYQTKGIKSYVKIKPQPTVYTGDKLKKLKSYESFILPAEIQKFSLQELKEKVKNMTMEECKDKDVNRTEMLKNIDDDIADINKMFSTFFEVKSNDLSRSITNISSDREDYTINDIKSVLKNYRRINTSAYNMLDSDMYCMYLDIIKVLNNKDLLDELTETQMKLIEELMLNGEIENKNETNLNGALKKMKKFS